MNKEVTDALWCLLHMALVNKVFETQKNQFKIVNDYILKLEQQLQEYKEKEDSLRSYCNRKIRYFNDDGAVKNKEIINEIKEQREWFYEIEKIYKWER